MSFEYQVMFEYQGKFKIVKVYKKGLENKKIYCMRESYFFSFEQDSQYGNRFQYIQWSFDNRYYYYQFWKVEGQSQNYIGNIDRNRVFEFLILRNVEYMVNILILIDVSIYIILYIMYNNIENTQIQDLIKRVWVNCFY